MQFLVAAAVLVLALAVLVQGIGEGTSTAGNLTGTAGVAYGGVCDNTRLKCNLHQATVVCMAFRTSNPDVCETGTSVDLGTCLCLRNCGAIALYEENGEFDAARDRCVGLVGTFCSIWFPACTAHASCDFKSGICECTEGYTPTSDGLRCTLTTTPTDNPLH